MATSSVALPHRNPDRDCSNAKKKGYAELDPPMVADARAIIEW
jgi:hypothetical protein